MDRVFSTNRTTVLFFGLLSTIVFPVGALNIYRATVGTGGYSMGFRTLLAVLLPLLTFFTWRNGRLFVGADGVRTGNRSYPRDRFRFALGTARLAFKDRPLTSLWRAEYDRLTVIDRAGASVEAIPLEMGRARLDALRDVLPR